MEEVESVRMGSSTYLEGQDDEKRAIFLLGSRLFKRVACRDTSGNASVVMYCMYSAGSSTIQANREIEIVRPV